jgi:hypothetical protein
MSAFAAAILDLVEELLVLDPRSRERRTVEDRDAGAARARRAALPPIAANLRGRRR